MTVTEDSLKYTNVTDDTREVVAGSLFVAIKGENFDGESAAAEMLAKGASAVITQTDLGLGESQIVVENARFAYAQAASEFYGNPTSRLRLIAVTGTNGKTTVATLIKAIIEKSGAKCGFIGTTEYDTCGKIYESVFSTPRQSELYRLFAEMAENGAQFCVMEASSQALDQYRIAGETFEAGIFTNLTQDHLDWHKTMENYYQAKKRLFTMCKKAVINVDDDWGRRLAGELAIPVTAYSVHDEYSFKCNMPGLFNIANSMAAIAACKLAGFSESLCIAAIEESKGVRGRCEVLHAGEYTVICDYAHTQDALEKILTCIRGFAKGRIICLFGAAGERDADKRPLMGATAAKHADELVITSDNPRFEAPDRIIAEVVAGLPAGTLYKTFVDRREAIEYALSAAKNDDVVLLAGKGHEVYQVIGDKNQPFDEREIVREILL
jgi:UDP-N-acetylmuramoyl-L-alanyl-D-glutamate--2,6-diaminopimelate ligase